MLRFHDRVVCKRRGVASLSHPITIRRRYRGFTSLWPQRDSKVSTSLLRTRQNGLGVRRVFRIPSSTATRLVLALRDSDRRCGQKEDEDIDRDRQNYRIHLTDKRRRSKKARCARALLPRSSLSIVAEWFGENDVRTIVVEISINDAIREISLAGAIELVRCGVSKQVLPRIPTPLAVWKISPCRRGK